MGAYASCRLGNFLVGLTKNDVDSDLISLFRASDKVILSEFTPDVLYLHPNFYNYHESLEENSDLRIIYYEAPLDVVRDRLAVMGYSLRTSKEAFQEWIYGELSNIEWMKNRVPENGKFKDLLRKSYENDIAILSTLTPELWIESLKVIKAANLKPTSSFQHEGPYENTLIGYMLSHEWYGFPGYDSLVALRLAIEACESETKLIYDLTDLVWSGYFDYDDDFIEYDLVPFAMEYSSKAKTIVLTEGKTDAWILEQSLKALYPHLKDYFSFLDFEGNSIGGGVGNLANMVKVFAGSGIINNVIALFDNDTAALAACKTFERLTLPPNIVIRRLPVLDFLSNYPTIGPSGEVHLNVNGIAASIELYLGQDVLKIDGERLIPVQWTGYDRGLNQYQGEVLEKPELHKRFKRKLENGVGTLGTEWDELKAVFAVIFSAFDEKHRSIICQRSRDYYIDRATPMLD